MRLRVPHCVNLAVRRLCGLIHTRAFAIMPLPTEPSSPTQAAPAAPAPVTANPSVFPAQPQIPFLPVGAPLSRHDSQRIPPWLERGELFLRVLLRMYVGLAVCCAPWIPYFWDRNPLFEHFPTLAIFAANGAVRGVVSGMGLLNLWFAVQDALRGRSGKR